MDGQTQTRLQGADNQREVDIVELAIITLLWITNANKWTKGSTKIQIAVQLWRMKDESEHLKLYDDDMILTKYICIVKEIELAIKIKCNYININTLKLR